MSDVKTLIHFRYRCTIAVLGLERQISLKSAGRARISLVLRPQTDDEATKALSRSDARAEIILTRTCAAATVRMLEDIEAGRMPAGSYTTDDHDAIETDGRIRDGYAPPFERLPATLQRSLLENYREAMDFCRAAVRLMRWRHDQPSPHNPIRNVSSPNHWSRDGRTWLRLPTYWLVGRFERVPHLNLTPDELAEIERMLAGDHLEPLGHDLFLEAWQQRRSSPRSSLVVCMAALECGIVGCTAALAPETPWLASNRRTPRFPELLRRCVPTLLKRSKIAVRITELPKTLIDKLTETAELRNSVAHRGSAKIRAEKLGEILHLCRDLLWLFDYLEGNEWAAWHIRPDTRRMLGITGRIDSISGVTTSDSPTQF